jgi:hypothetical protein
MAWKLPVKADINDGLEACQPFRQPVSSVGSCFVSGEKPTDDTNYPTSQPANQQISPSWSPDMNDGLEAASHVGRHE